MMNACLNHSNPDRIAADFDRDEMLGALLEAGLDVEVAAPKAFPAVGQAWTVRYDLATGNKTFEGWVNV